MVLGTWGLGEVIVAQSPGNRSAVETTDCESTDFYGTGGDGPGKSSGRKQDAASVHDAFEFHAGLWEVGVVESFLGHVGGRL
jgi:hypothetical protein